MIPKIVHFTWKTEDLPKVMGRFFERWKALHPGWDIRLWTDATMREFVAREYPDLLAIYDGYPRNIQRADSFRYMVLNRLGGIYSDLDVEPFKPVDELLKYEAFTGVEPDEHMGTDRTHAGVPYLFTNAFMGSVPGHPWWREVLGLMPKVARLDTFYATGPSLITASILRLPKAQRPVLLMPLVWSPLRDGGLKTRKDAKVAEMVGHLAPIIEGKEGQALVSHLWLTTWVPWHKRSSHLAAPLQIPTHIKWWLRKRRYPELAAMTIPDPVEIYDRQDFGPAIPGATVFVGVRLDGGRGLSPELANTLGGLTYPRALLRFGFWSDAQGEAERAEVSKSVAGVGGEVIFDVARQEAENQLLETGAGVADKLLLVAGDVSEIPADAIERLLGAPQPVVAANAQTQGGEASDDELFRYRYGGGFRFLYKAGAAWGMTQSTPELRTRLGDQAVFRVVPVDGVGDTFVLVDSTVIRAGVRYAEDYKKHRGGAAFAIKARDLGFEAAGMPEVVVRVAG